MKKKVNKSELIRAMIAKNPTAKAPEILALLKKDGVVVSLPLVYQAKRKDEAPKTASPVTASPLKRGRKPAAAAAVSSTSTNDLFASMSSFVDAAGGLDKAIAILSVFKN